MRACWLAVAIASGVLQAQSPSPDASSPDFLKPKSVPFCYQLLLLSYEFPARRSSSR